MQYILVPVSPRQGAPARDSWIKKIVLPLLEAILPKANPDFHYLYASVTNWWIEVDETGDPQREIGFDAEGNALLIGPAGDNMGYWMDTAVKYKISDYSPVEAQRFQSEWKAFLERHPKFSDE